MSVQSEKVSVILVIYNARKYIKPVFDSIFHQTYKNLEVIAVINGSNDGSKEMIVQNYPSVRIIDPGENFWFARGNNVAIEESTGELIQLVNQDVVLEPGYIEKMVDAFSDPKVAAATGKILRFDFDNNKKLRVIDTTGVVISKSGRARDRGQLEEDNGQYDKETEVFAVSGAVPMYRRTALEEARYCQNYKCEYFDEDFSAYWEDVDLSWRFNHLGFRNVYVPQAVAFHGRTAGSAKGGYFHIFSFIKHHSLLSREVRRLNYKNHIFMYLKNKKWPSIQFVLREIMMLVYILIFEPSTLKIIPTMVRQWPRIKRKRDLILK